MPVSSKCNGGKHACSVGNAKLQTKRQAVSWWWWEWGRGRLVYTSLLWVWW